MNTDEFQKQMYLSLREEIRESKTRSFWILVLGTLIIVSAGYLGAVLPTAFASAAIPIVLLVMVLAYAVEQNSIIRAGRFLREEIEAKMQETSGWEHWLESNRRYREVDRFFFAGFIVSLMAFFAISCSLSLVQLDQLKSEIFVKSAAAAYALAAVCVIVVLIRHWHSCTTTSDS